MGISVGGGSGPKSEPNVVPFCDILLVLLIIFMVITPLTQKGIDIKLPEPAPVSDVNPPTSRTIVVNIKKDGGIVINQEPVDRALLRGRLKEIFDVRADKTAFIKAESQVKYGDVVRVMDICKGAGIDHLGIITEKQDTQ